MTSTVIAAILTQLRDDIARNDGTAAAATLDLLRTAAGDTYADQVISNLITAGLSRLVVTR